jgi:hypothetical protein
MQPEYPVEQRVSALAGGIRTAISTIADTLRPPGGRAPFTQRLSRTDALDWWAQHRRDELGAAALQAMPPQAIAQLDVELGQHMAAQDPSTYLD